MQAECKGGDLLEKMQRNAMGVNKGRGKAGSKPATLALGISKHQSKRWQNRATVLDKKFVAESRAPKKPSTTSLFKAANGAGVSFGTSNATNSR